MNSLDEDILRRGEHRMEGRSSGGRAPPRAGQWRRRRWRASRRADRCSNTASTWPAAERTVAGAFSSRAQLRVRPRGDDRSGERPLWTPLLRSSRPTKTAARALGAVRNNRHTEKFKKPHEWVSKNEQPRHACTIAPVDGGEVRQRRPLRNFTQCTQPTLVGDISCCKKIRAFEKCELRGSMGDD